MTAPTSLAGPRGMRIGLWGAPGSGKSTFLGSLQIATVSAPGQHQWLIHGVDDAASNFLSESTDQLRNRHMFPSATVNSRHLRWRLVRPEPAVRRRRLPRRPAVAAGQSVLELDIVDVAGGTYRSVPTGPEPRETDPVDDDLGFPFEEDNLDDQDVLLQQLSECDGILYLFDPTDPNPYDHVQRTLEQLSRRSYENGRLQDGRLPHHLAVCITKFDDPAVYVRARNAGILSTAADPYAPGSVADRDAARFFQILCTDRDSRSRTLVHDSIQRYFAPERVRHFVTSAVGFYIGRTGRFRPNDFVNVVDTVQGVRIRGEVRPINVLQPLHWLETQLLAERPAVLGPPAAPVP